MNSEHSEIITLDNNLKLQLVNVPGGKSALFAVAFHAGSMYEEEFGTGSNDGISHFLEHMFFKGTPTRTSKQVNEEFTRLGADLNAYTSYDHTVYYAKVPTRNLHKAVELWHDLLINRTIDPTEFEAERQVVLQEIQWYEDMPETDTNFNVRKHHFVNTPLEHTILGTQDSISTISIEMMSDYITRFYTLDNAVVTLTGGFDLVLEKQFFTSFFSDPISQPSKKPIYPPGVKLDPQKSGISYHYSTRQKPLTYASLCWTSPGTSSSDFFPLLLLNTYIGNSRTSLLYRKITSKGIASVCRYGFEPLYDVSASSIFFVSPPNKTKGVFQKIIELLLEVKDLEINPQIVSELKEEVWGTYITEIENPTNYGVDLIQKFIKFRHQLLTEEFKERIDQITANDMQEAKDRLLENFYITVYATGTIPQDWTPDFPKNGPW
ncbi:MAG: insulinase family protein [Candidatus Heimdallarchaeota archaeon]|nr:MAG: insulinase family protein [Candidatus Heimdallarchaeota archaeon]